MAANAQMAELVDALVSNTSGFTSMPVRSRLWVQKTPLNRLILRGFFTLSKFSLERVVHIGFVGFGPRVSSRACR